MKKYADKRENLIYQKYESLNDVLKSALSKAFVYEKAITVKGSVCFSKEQ